MKPGIQKIIAIRDESKPCGHCQSSIHYGRQCPNREASIAALMDEPSHLPNGWPKKKPGEKSRVFVRKSAY